MKSLWAGVRAGAAVPILLVAALAQAPAPALADDASVTGLLDVAAAPANRAVELNKLNFGGTAFDAYRLRLFFDGQPSDAIAVHAQIIATDAADMGIYSAYGTISPWRERDLHLEAGKIPWAIGTFGPRTYSNRNPLMGTPLIYQYHTTLRADQVAPSVDDILAQAGMGQFGVRYGSGNTQRGLPIVYDACWDAGVVALGTLRPFEFSGGVTAGTPSSPRAGRDDNFGKSVLGRVGLAPHPAVRVGVSGATGPYVAGSTQPSLPAGAAPEDFDQNVLMADAEWLFSRVELRAEGVVSTWETPFAGNLTVRGYYVEGKYSFPIGLYLAARWDELRFSEVADSTGVTRPWDDDVRRFEGGAGFRIVRRVILKGIYQLTELQGSAGRADRRHDLVAGQLSLSF